MAQAARARPVNDDLAEVYERLRRHRGPAGWWPGETPFEVCVGAILVQNTAWPNVEKALAVVRAAGRLSYAGLAGLGEGELAALIRPSGCYNVKAKRLAAFVAFLGREYGGRVEGMAEQEPLVLRAQLLAVSGIGRETADSIVLYAAGLPLFVIDAYTRRVFGRLGLIRGDESYDALQERFMSGLPADAGLFNDYHAQIVIHAKDVCRPRPRCLACPLDSMCPRVESPSTLGPSRRKITTHSRKNRLPRTQGGSHMRFRSSAFAVLAALTIPAAIQAADVAKSASTVKADPAPAVPAPKPGLHRYMVVRTFPAGALDGLDAAGKKQVNITNASKAVRWVYSYANADKTKTFCIYDGPSEQAIRDVASANKIPVDYIVEIPVVLSPR